MDEPGAVQKSPATNTPMPAPVAASDSTGRRFPLLAPALLIFALFILGFMMLSGRLQFATNENQTAVKQYHEHAKQILANCKLRTKNTNFGVTSAAGSGHGNAEFDDNYSIDVRKTQSLVRPYLGEIKLRRKTVWAKWDGPGKADEEWKDVFIHSQYEDGSWKTADQQIVDISGPFTRTDKGRSDGLKWEFRNFDYGQQVIAGSLEDLGRNGWEVYAVTGGQPFISASQTPEGPGDTTITTNTVKFTPNVYYLKRPQ